MYEIQSCGVTIDFCKSHFDAINAYDRCTGPEVVLYKYNERGQKFVVAEKLQNIPATHSRT